MSFFVNYLALRGIYLGDRRTMLKLAIAKLYQIKFITEKIHTYSNEIPAVREVLDILEAMADDPSEYVVRVEAEGEKIVEDAV